MIWSQFALEMFLALFGISAWICGHRALSKSDRQLNKAMEILAEAKADKKFALEIVRMLKDAVMPREKKK
jgi:hypothetical protein